MGFSVSERWIDSSKVSLDTGDKRIELTRELRPGQSGRPALGEGVGLTHLKRLLAYVDGAFEALVTPVSALPANNKRYRIALVAAPDGAVFELLQDLYKKAAKPTATRSVP